MPLLETYPLLHQALKTIGLTAFHTLWSGCLLLLLLIVILKIIPAPQAKVRFAVSWTVLQFLLLLLVVIFFQQWKGTTIVSDPSENLAPISVPTDEVVLSTEPIATKQHISSPLLTDWQAVLHQWAPLGASLWLLGCLFHLARLVGGLGHIRRLRAYSQPLSHDWEKRLARLKQQLGLRVKVVFLSSYQTTVPLTFGWLKPVVLIPASLLTQLAPEQIEMIVLHELAHIRRHDYLWSLSQSVAEVVLFYHPAYWYIARVLEREREFACDQLTVDIIQQPRAYARTLLSIAATKTTSYGLAATGRRDLSARIKRIVTPVTDRGSIPLVPTLLLISGLGLASVAYAWQSPHPIEQDRTNETIKTLTNQSTTNQEKQWLYILNGKVQTRRPAFLDQDSMKGQWETFTVPKTEEWIKPYLTSTQQHLLLDSTYGGILFIVSEEFIDDLNRTNAWPPPSATYPDQKKKQNFGIDLILPDWY